MNKLWSANFVLKNCLQNSSLRSHLVVRNNSNLVKIIDDESSQMRRIVMCNEKQRNSLGLQMIETLEEAIKSTNYDKSRVLVISSSSPTVFSSGHNLKELTTESGNELHRKIFRKFSNLCIDLKNLPIPIIAEVRGLAAAAGLQLAASCDIIVASKEASFSTPGVKFGVFCSTPGVALTRNINLKVAAKMLFTGESITADQALVHGLVSEIVEKEKLEERVNQLAKQIVANSRHVVALGKKCLYEHLDKNDLNYAYNLACEAMLDNLTYTDTQSGLKAFANKQKPVWNHKNTKIKPN